MNSCAICMKEELDDENIYTTNCKHIFCKDCLDDWFQRGNQTCPLCRSNIDSYKYKDENYKLVVHTVENESSVGDISLNQLISHNLVVRNIIKQNLRLKLYTFTSVFLFLYVVNSYLFTLSKNNALTDELNACNLNNTQLRNNLYNCESLLPSTSYLGRGFYVSMFNGEISRRCFYPLNFYNICFNK